MVITRKTISTGFLSFFIILFLTGFALSDEGECSRSEELPGSEGVKTKEVASDHQCSGIDNCRTVSFWDEIPLSPSTAMPEEILDDYWHGQFERVNREVADADDPGIIFFGNSITWMWTEGSATGFPVWEREYAQFNPVNMGNSGDITPVMLYRATHGNLDFDKDNQPKVAVLLCGTNNFVVSSSAGGKVQWGLGPDCPPEDVANGARAIAQAFRRHLPETRVIMLGILPVSNAVKWEKCQQVNAANAALNYNEKEVVFMDLQDKFLLPDGSLNMELFTDGTHLTEEGYSVWAGSLDSIISATIHAEPIDPLKIMLIGGSITEGASSSSSYRRYLDGMLRREGMMIDFVGSLKKHNDNQVEPDCYQYDIDHEGHWGKNSDWLAVKLPGMLSQDIPDVAVIHAGVEDILSAEGNADVLMDQVVQNIDIMVQTLRSKNNEVNIVLANVSPFKGAVVNVEELNQRLSQYAKTHSTKMSPMGIADLHTGFSPYAEFSTDGKMPNETGASMMAEVLSNAIKSMLVGNPCK